MVYLLSEGGEMESDEEMEGAEGGEATPVEDKAAVIFKAHTGRKGNSQTHNI